MKLFLLCGPCIIYRKLFFYMDRNTFYLLMVSSWHLNQYWLISTHTLQHITHPLSARISFRPKKKISLTTLSLPVHRSPYLNPYRLIWEQQSPHIYSFLKKAIVKYPCYNRFAARPPLSTTNFTYASTRLQWWLNLFYPSCAELQRLVCVSRELYTAQKWKWVLFT